MMGKCIYQVPSQDREFSNSLKLIMIENAIISQLVAWLTIFRRLSKLVSFLDQPDRADLLKLG
jgi:hypothetical protein